MGRDGELDQVECMALAFQSRHIDLMVMTSLIKELDVLDALPMLTLTLT